MINPLSDFIDLLDSETSTDDSIDLLPEHIDQAVRLSESATHSTDLWQTYIQALALIGFKQWLSGWASDLDVSDLDYSVHSVYTDQTAFYLQINRLNVGVVAVPSLMQPTIDVPKVLLDLSQWTPHLYVLIEVKEEQMQIQFCGYLRWDQFNQFCQSHVLHDASASDYAIPLNWFNPDPTTLLVELRCLDVTTLDQIWMPQKVHLEESLESDAVDRLKQPIPTLFGLQRPMNVNHWLSDRLDDIAQVLGWLLLPPLYTGSALRSARHELDMIEVHIPPEARGVYRDLQLGYAPLRLYAMTWVLSSSRELFEWTLLIIVGPPPGTSQLPNELRLQVRDQVQLLSDHVLLNDSDHIYLYAQVSGGLDDRFSVTISLPDTATITFPPFVFKP